MSDIIKIRQAVTADLPILNTISVASKSYWKYPEEWINAWKRDLTITPTDLEDMRVNVAEIDNYIVGFGAIKENESEYEIMHLWVFPDFMTQGIGKIILQSLIKSTIPNKPIKVESDPNAYGFYTKMGFNKVGEIQSYPEDRYLPVLIKDQ